jgi:hypothetical protein
LLRRRPSRPEKTEGARSEEFQGDRCGSCCNGRPITVINASTIAATCAIGTGIWRVVGCSQPARRNDGKVK